MRKRQVSPKFKRLLKKNCTHMRLFLQTIAYFLCLTNLSAQDLPIDFENSVWTQWAIYYDDEIQDYITICPTLEASFDTSINNKNYTYVDGFGGGFFREESGVVFFLPDTDIYPWNMSLREFEVFDFNLEAGDSTWLYAITFDDLDSARVEIDHADEIEVLDGSFRKRLEIIDVQQAELANYSACGTLTWVEGVGATGVHPFYWFGECFSGDSQMQFNCLKVNNLPVYGGCDCQATEMTPVAELDQDQIRVFPNPFSSEIRIVSPGLPVRVKLFDSLGRALPIHLDGEIIRPVEDLQHGIYYLTFQLGQNTFCEVLVKS